MQLVLTEQRNMRATELAGWLRAAMSRQGLQMADSPREVYFTDVFSAGPIDEVCDIAFPIR